MPEQTVTPAPRTGSAARGLIIAVLLVAGLVGLAGGAAVRARSQPPASAALGLLATARLVDVTLDPDPQARYEVFVANRGTAPITVTAIAVQRGARPAVVNSYRQPIAPSSSTLLPFAHPLTCDAAGDEAVAVRLVVRTEPTQDGDGIPVSVVSTGTAIGVGPCALAGSRFPPGWQDRALAEAVDLRPDGMTLTVLGLTGSGTVDGLRAGSWAFALVAPAAIVPGESVTLRAGLPAGQCQDWGFQDTVPAGVQLLSHGPDGERVSYVPVGPRLSRWLLAVAGSACS